MKEQELEDQQKRVEILVGKRRDGGEVFPCCQIMVYDEQGQFWVAYVWSGVWHEPVPLEVLLEAVSQNEFFNNWGFSSTHSDEIAFKAKVLLRAENGQIKINRWRFGEAARGFKKAFPYSGWPLL